MPNTQFKTTLNLCKRQYKHFVIFPKPIQPIPYSTSLLFQNAVPPEQPRVNHTSLVVDHTPASSGNNSQQAGEVFE